MLIFGLRKFQAMNAPLALAGLAAAAGGEKALDSAMTHLDWGQQRRIRQVDARLGIMPDEPRHNAPGGARPTPTAYPLTLEDVSRLFEEAGLPRNARTLQRYCAAGRLDCIKEETATGLAYFVDPISVERAIKQLAQLHGLTDEARHSATSEDMSHHVAQATEPLSPSDTPRPSTAGRDNETAIYAG